MKQKRKADRCKRTRYKWSPFPPSALSSIFLQQQWHVLLTVRPPMRPQVNRVPFINGSQAKQRGDGRAGRGGGGGGRGGGVRFSATVLDFFSHFPFLFQHILKTHQPPSRIMSTRLAVRHVYLTSKYCQYPTTSFDYIGLETKSCRILCRKLTVKYDKTQFPT